MIVQAAIRQDGVIFVGKRHHEILKEMVRLGYRFTLFRGEQGFVDDCGDFLDRREAAQAALEIGQVKELSRPPFLFSEDLY